MQFLIAIGGALLLLAIVVGVWFGGSYLLLMLISRTFSLTGRKRR